MMAYCIILRDFLSRCIALYLSNMFILQNLFKSNGGCVKECCKVKEIIPGDVVTVITNDSVINAKTVILAAGKSLMKRVISF